MTTRKEEYHYNNGVALGVDIDIFPLDAWDNDLKKAKKEAKSINRDMFYLNMTKLNRADSVNPVKRMVKSVVMSVTKIFGSRYYIRRILKKAIKTDRKSGYLGCKVWCVYGARGIIPAEAFEESMDVEFEGGKYPAPKGYDTYLTCLYGDYLPEPPIEKQKTHHAFKTYKLEENKW